MRRLILICSALCAFAIANLLKPQQAAAFGCEHRYDLEDCYGYRYVPRGYYPYYNSGHWRPAREMRWRKRMSRRHYAYPQYNPAWGHPVDGYHHRAWHHRHHGRHSRWHW